MAQLKNTIILGDLSVTGAAHLAKVYTNILNAPTASNGTTFGPGTNGQVLTSNGTQIYWGQALNATINAGTASRIAYYSGANAISAGSIVTDGSYLRNIGGYNNTSYSLSAASAIINSWIRTKGSTGWYNEDYGGGWYMSDTSWIRSYGSKPVYIDINSDNSYGIGTHRLALGLSGSNHVSIMLRGGSVMYGFAVNNDGNWYFGKRTSNSMTSSSGDTYLLKGNATSVMPYTTNTIALGGSSNRWSQGHFNGIVYVGNDSKDKTNQIRIFGMADSTTTAGQDTNDRPTLSISGNYPQLVLTSTGINNTSHGPTISLAAYDTASATSGNFKAFTFGIPGTNATWMDLGYGANQTNPHANGINGYNNNPAIMRFRSDRQIIHYGPVIIDNQLINNNFNEGLRINTSTNGWAGIVLGGATGSLNGCPDKSWFIARRGAVGSSGGFGDVGDLTLEEQSSAGTGLTIHQNAGGMSLYVNKSNSVAAFTIKNINTLAANQYSYGIVHLTPNLVANGNTLGYLTGVALSSGNSGYLNFKYVGSNNDDNYLSLGLYGNDHRIRLYKSGTFITPSGDATLKIYDVTNTTYGNETMAIQTAFDGVDPQTHTYVTSYENRCNLLLQPRGGQVYVGWDNTAVGDTSASLLVNKSIKTTYNIDTDNTAFATALWITGKNSNESTGANTFDESKASWGITFRRQWSDGTWNGTSAGIYMIPYGSWRAGLAFRVKNNTTNTGNHDVTAITIRHDGNVGIGQNNPTYKLYVNGTTYITDTVYVTNTSGAKNILIGNQDSSGANCPVRLQAANGTLYIGNGTAWSGTGGTMNTAIFMTKDLKIGIGTTSPNALLHAAGDIRMQSATPNFYITGTTTTAANEYSIIRFGTKSTDNQAYIFLNGADRTDDGGKSMMTIRNNIGDLRLNNYIICEVNNQWLTPGRIQIGRKDATANYTDRAIIGITNGNLHLDAYKGYHIYLNHYNITGDVYSTDFLPITTRTYYLGSSSLFWKGGYFDQIFVSDQTGFTSSSAGKPGVYIGCSGQGFIEMVGANPFIDFHYNNTTADFTGRLISVGNVILQYNTNNNDACFQIYAPANRWAYLRLNSANSAFWDIATNSAASGSAVAGSLRFRYQGVAPSTTAGVWITPSQVLYGACWNDYAEYRVSSINEPGRVVKESPTGELTITTARLERGCEIISDTFGFAIGIDEDDRANAPTAAAGRVLAYTDKPRETFELGMPVCSGPNGTVSQMTEEEARMYPWCIIGTVSEIPTYEEWGTGKVKVDGRIWIRIR